MALKYRPRMVVESHRRGGRVVEGAPLLREAAGSVLPEANLYIAGVSERCQIGGNRRIANFLRVRDPFAMRSLTHFIGFRDDRYHAAVRVFGQPDFFHLGFDRRALREIADGDVVVFADGPHDQAPRDKSFPDIIDGAEIGWIWPKAGGAA